MRVPAKPKRVPFVEVHWSDAASCATWRGPDELPHVQPCMTRGWLLEEGKDEVVIAATIQVDSPDVGEIIAIPRGMVKRIRRLKVSYGR